MKKTGISRKSLVSSRKSNNEKILARSALNELTSNYSRLTTKIAFTMAGAGQRAPLFDWMAHGHVAFTMAEILLSLTIIGVVAAITLPSLTGNINERTWNTQRKALYARMSQAIALMPSLNQYANADNFVANGLSKVLKINNICEHSNITDCGITSKQMTNAVGTKIDVPTKISDLNPKNVLMNFVDDNGISYSFAGSDGDAVAFETANGESILTFYNPTCRADLNEKDYYGAGKVCANFLYDLNGTKGPNTLGKDIGVISVLYPSDSLVVAPLVYPRNNGLNVTFAEASTKCTELDGEYRAPNIGEVISIFYNGTLFTLENTHYWSCSRYNSTKAWTMSGRTGRIFLQSVNDTNWKKVRCVQR